MVHSFKSPFYVFTSFLILGLALPVFAASPVVEGEYLIKYRGSNAPDGLQKIMSKLSQKASLKASFGHIGVAHIALKPGVSINELKNDPDVEYVEPNFMFKKNQDEVGVIQGTLSRDQISASSVEGGLGFTQSGGSSFRTTVQNSWNIIKPVSAGKIIVAVIDTGVDRSHYIFKPALPGCNVSSAPNNGNQALWVNSGEVAGNGMDDDGNGFIDDVNGFNFISNSGAVIDDDGHGTHVAGTVVGTSVDIIGSCNESKILIMPLKFLGSSGSGSTSDAIKAMYYAVQNGAKVINNSWGGGSYSRSLHDAMIYAYNHDVVVVTAAGNSAQNNDSTSMYPANYDTPSNIAVAAVDNSGALASFSNYGKNRVSVSAPGVNVYSSIPMSMGAFGQSSGTSMASPFVAGLAALILRENSNYNSYDVKNVLINSSDVFAALSQKVYSSGEVNSERSLNAAVSSRSMMSSKSALPSYTPVYLAERSPSSVTATSTGGCGTIQSISGGFGGGSGGLLAGILMIPLLIWGILRRRAESPESRRRFERFQMNSEVKLKVGDRELTGKINTISQGGLSFNLDQALEGGGIVTMRIASPDGHEMVEVQGHIVWSEQSQAYGVQFDQARDGALAMIRQWTQGLMKV